MLLIQNEQMNKDGEDRKKTRWTSRKKKAKRHKMLTQICFLFYNKKKNK